MCPYAPAPLSPSVLAHAGDDALGLQSVYGALASAEAHLLRFAWLGDHLALAEWARCTDEAETAYSQPGHHTLSCYLDGGYRTERERLPGCYGGPERLCTLPGEHESRWWVRGPLRFVHLYFMPEHFTRRAVRELDREPRELTLADRTYFEDPSLAALCRSLTRLDWSDADDRLRANAAAHEALSRLLRTQSTRRPLAPRGGLAVATRRRLRDYIDAHLARPLTLGELAEQACLSEYHFARMFRLSFGVPPHVWIARERLERAQALLRSTELSLTELALACGFADASHLGHRFRRALGVSPGAYRRLVGAPV